MLNIPDEKFRDKVKKSIEENLTTIRRELGEANAGLLKENMLNDILTEEFARLIGPMTARQKDELPVVKMATLRESMMHEIGSTKRGNASNAALSK